MGRTTSTKVTMRWPYWFGAAVVLAAIGFGALVVLGDGKTDTGADDSSLLNGLAYAVTFLSWLGAIPSVAIGVTLITERSRSPINH